jgi:hypothetical protein
VTLPKQVLKITFTTTLHHGNGDSDGMTTYGTDKSSTNFFNTFSANSLKQF